MWTGGGGAQEWKRLFSRGLLGASPECTATWGPWAALLSAAVPTSLAPQDRREARRVCPWDLWSAVGALVCSTPSPGSSLVLAGTGDPCREAVPRDVFETPLCCSKAQFPTGVPPVPTVITKPWRWLCHVQAPGVRALTPDLLPPACQADAVLLSNTTGPRVFFF